MRLCLLLVGVLGVGSLRAQGSILGDTGRVAILPDSAMPAVLRQCSRSAPTEVAGFWRPSPDDVRAAEDAIDRALVRALDSLIARDSLGHAAWRTRQRASWPDEYYRQYAGLIHQDGRRTIYINALPSGYPEEFSHRVAQRPATRSHPYSQPDWWRVLVPHICDGGESFWGAEYDPRSGRVLSLQFNGRA